MENIDSYKPFTLSPLHETAIPFEGRAVVVRVDQRRFKERVVASLPYPDEEKAEIIDSWKWNPVHVDPMDEYMKNLEGHEHSPLKKFYLKVQRFITPIGIASGYAVNIDAEQIVKSTKVDPSLTAEQKLMIIKQRIDAVLRHEEEHVRQHGEGKYKDEDKATKRYWIIGTMSKMGIGAAAASVGAFAIIGIVNRELPLSVNFPLLGHETIQAISVSAELAKKIGYPVIALDIASTLGYCVNHLLNYNRTNKEKDAREQAGSQYFDDKSPLEVFFEGEKVS